MRLNFDVRSSNPPAPLLQAWFLGTMPYGFLFSWCLYRNPARTTDAADQAAIN